MSDIDTAIARYRALASLQADPEVDAYVTAVAGEEGEVPGVVLACTQFKQRLAAAALLEKRRRPTPDGAHWRALMGTLRGSERRKRDAQAFMAEDPPESAPCAQALLCTTPAPFAPSLWERIRPTKAELIPPAKVPAHARAALEEKLLQRQVDVARGVVGGPAATSTVRSRPVVLPPLQSRGRREHAGKQSGTGRRLLVSPRTLEHVRTIGDPTHYGRLMDIVASALGSNLTLGYRVAEQTAAATRSRHRALDVAHQHRTEFLRLTQRVAFDVTALPPPKVLLLFEGFRVCIAVARAGSAELAEKELLAPVAATARFTGAQWLLSRADYVEQCTACGFAPSAAFWIRSNTHNTPLPFHAILQAVFPNATRSLLSVLVGLITATDSTAEGPPAGQRWRGCLPPPPAVMVAFEEFAESREQYVARLGPRRDTLGSQPGGASSSASSFPPPRRRPTQTHVLSAIAGSLQPLRRAASQARRVTMAVKTEEGPGSDATPPPLAGDDGPANVRRASVASGVFSVGDREGLQRTFAAGGGLLASAKSFEQFCHTFFVHLHPQYAPAPGPEAVAGIFAAHDRDGDGFLALDEFASAYMTEKCFRYRLDQK